LDFFPLGSGCSQGKLAKPVLLLKPTKLVLQNGQASFTAETCQAGFSAAGCDLVSVAFLLPYSVYVVSDLL
jgi:hypothetical protein